MDLSLNKHSHMRTQFFLSRSYLTIYAHSRDNAQFQHQKENFHSALYTKTRKEREKKRKRERGRERE